MSQPMTAKQILERQFLEMRCGLLDLAAAFDRISRAEGFSEIANDEQMQLLAKGLEVVADSEGQRAERLQLLFSDEYVEGWNR
ncbi:hypothetical protein KOR42_39130 [Thalassoglobus neptunius]|uniref:Uncharacterized protein n=1 Tax=Thalassoglobus neptunius TaxID=1938619 RepID=A0A5C5WGR0_9PLAN|nr:hypothetical protein [Thalassoglobus neptunius]TWT49840.1 hypothetical protein KOR42_39130 [Thalassoglobus neptunius]